MTMQEGENNVGKAGSCILRQTHGKDECYLNSLVRLPVDLQFNTRADTISVYAPSFRSTRRELWRVRVSMPWTSVFYDVRLPKVYLPRAMSSRGRAYTGSGDGSERSSTGTC